MSDGGYDGYGCSDPDYYDIEFREQNPGVYGNDELMQSYRGTGRNQRQQRQRRSYSTSESDRQFHQEYLKWRKAHSDKIAFFRSPSEIKRKKVTVNDGNETAYIWFCVILGLIVYPLLIFMLVQSCE
ncbi:MAG: hypothetical protein K5764_03015 [Prevotella sp.]|nr:hypothetical protein [Prevotella sp.]